MDGSLDWWFLVCEISPIVQKIHIYKSMSRTFLEVNWDLLEESIL